MQRILLRKNLLVHVLKKLSRNLFEVGDYTGRATLWIEDRHFKKNGFDVR
jgi:hypothetical protein